MSWSIISIEELAKITPVTPPTVNKNTNPKDQIIDGEFTDWDPCIVANHLKILIPVGMAIIIVAEVK